MRDDAAGAALPDAGDARARARRRLRSRTSARPADQVPWIMEHRPIALEAIDHELFYDEMQQNMHHSALTELPRSDRSRARGCWSSSAPTRGDEADELRAAIRRGRPQARLCRGRDQHLRGQAAGAEALGGARGRARRDRVPARRPRPLAGLGGLGRAAGALRRLHARPEEALRRVRLPRRDVRPHRPGLRPLADRLRPPHAAGLEDVPRLHGGGGRPRASRTAARSPASTATASSAPSCCRSSTARRSSRPSASSSGSGTPTGR